jgi:Zn-dependent M28 family amino/carboxypeptidase
VQPTPPQKDFDGLRAWKDVETQVNFGPRIPGSPGHQRAIAWIQSELNAAHWSVSVQETTEMGHPVRNVIAVRSALQGQSASTSPPIILGAHFDTRRFADQDPDPANRQSPVPGANDGASGVAVLLEIARSLPAGLQIPVWLVFFDAEDQGSLPDWDWILGSTAYAKSLEIRPSSVVVVDMIGDADLNIYQEHSSTPALVNGIWKTAADRGYAQFIPQFKFSMIDDHTPFLQKGIPAVDLIDFDYPYWHTVSDTPDKVSSDSLKAVGDVLIKWILSLQPLAK